MRPDQTKMRSAGVVNPSRNWAERRTLIGSLRGATTTCELIAANNSVDYSQPAPSLGLVKVRNVQVTVAEGEPWSAQQLSKVFRAAQPDLFNRMASSTRAGTLPGQGQVPVRVRPVPGP
jgi:hypothetical protein